MSLRRHDPGVTLIELMVALVLLSVALLGIAAAFAPGRMAIQAGDQSTTAVFLARQVVEDMRNRAYDADSDEITGGNFPNLAYGSISGYPNFRRTVTIADDVPETGTKTVTVAVFYRDDSGAERSVTLAMIFTRAN
jgi:prepilin-type N-terminal cleavage/methylation domain-containing protein